MFVQTTFFPRFQRAEHYFKEFRDAAWRVRTPRIPEIAIRFNGRSGRDTVAVQSLVRSAGVSLQFFTLVNVGGFFFWFLAFSKKKTMKYILVTGGVMSGVGKGIIASSIGTLLKSCGVHVTSIKIDPYLNIDAGTFSPYEHGMYSAHASFFDNPICIIIICDFLFYRRSVCARRWR